MAIIPQIVSQRPRRSWGTCPEFHLIRELAFHFNVMLPASRTWVVSNSNKHERRQRRTSRKTGLSTGVPPGIFHGGMQERNDSLSTRKPLRETYWKERDIYNMSSRIRAASPSLPVCPLVGICSHPNPHVGAVMRMVIGTRYHWLHGLNTSQRINHDVDQCTNPP